MSPPVMIFRAEPGASETAKRVAALGLTAILSPALTIRDRPDIALPDLTPFAGLVFTSANGIRAFAGRSEERDLPAWCVGPATAQAGEHLGFQDIRRSSGDAGDLANLIISNATLRGGPLLHVANKAAKGKLRHTLQSAGHTVVFAPIYEAGTASGLSPDARRCLQNQTTSIGLFHSEKGAEAFLAISRDLPLHQLHAVTISAQAARPLQQAGLASISSAQAPNEDALMDHLKMVVATLSA